MVAGQLSMIDCQPSMVERYQIWRAQTFLSPDFLWEYWIKFGIPLRLIQWRHSCSWFQVFALPLPIDMILPLTHRDSNIWRKWLYFYRMRNSKSWRRQFITKYIWRNTQCCQIRSWAEVTSATTLSESKGNRKADSAYGTCFIYRPYGKNKRWV